MELPAARGGSERSVELVGLTGGSLVGRGGGLSEAEVRGSFAHSFSELHAVDIDAVKPVLGAGCHNETRSAKTA